MHISEEKKFLRQQIKERIDRMDDDERAAEGRTVGRVLLKNIPEGSRICAYAPIKGEANIFPLIQSLLDRGDTVYLPVFKDESMIYRQVTNLDALKPGDLTIGEPPATNPELGNNPVDIVLVPGRAFDRSGGRLGRGSGGFDQWIEQYRALRAEPKFWGVCYQCQLLNEVPTEPHDALMDVVVTAQEWIEIEKEK